MASTRSQLRDPRQGLHIFDLARQAVDILHQHLDHRRAFNVGTLLMSTLIFPPNKIPVRHNEYHVARAFPCWRTRPAETNSRNLTLSVLRFALVMDASCAMVRRSVVRSALST